MRHVAAFVCFAWIFVSAADIAADEDTRIPIEGSYLLIQEDGYQRVLSIDGGGTASVISSLQASIGFTTGQGSWAQSGRGTATARIVDFSLAGPAGTPAGPTLSVYELTFSEPVEGKFTRVSGALNGQQFAHGDNPLKPSKPVVRSFGMAFQGERISPK